jgi:hypothetical protein
VSFGQRSKSRRRMCNFPLGLHLSGGRRCNFLYNLFAHRIQCVSKRQGQSFPLSLPISSSFTGGSVSLLCASTSSTTVPLNRCHEWKEALAKGNLLLLMETLKNQVDAGPAGHNFLHTADLVPCDHNSSIPDVHAASRCFALQKRAFGLPSNIICFVFGP